MRNGLLLRQSIEPELPQEAQQKLKFGGLLVQREVMPEQDPTQENVELREDAALQLGLRVESSEQARSPLQTLTEPGDSEDRQSISFEANIATDDNDSPAASSKTRSTATPAFTFHRAPSSDPGQRRGTCSPKTPKNHGSKENSPMRDCNSTDKKSFR